jgi:hypothetical protein
LIGRWRDVQKKNTSSDKVTTGLLCIDEVMNAHEQHRRLHDYYPRSTREAGSIA